MNKFISKIIPIFLVAVFVFLVVSPSQAQTVAELQAQIQLLLKQVQELQQQLVKIQGTTSEWCYVFNANLKIGDKGEDIKALQIALSKEGFKTTDSEGYFGESTAAAVSGFQNKYKQDILLPLGLNYPTGFVGQSTRNKLNSIYGCKTQTQAQTQQQTQTQVQQQAQTQQQTQVFPSCNLSISPNSITKGQSAVLSWTAKDAESITIDNGIGSVTPIASGSRTISPSLTTFYTAIVRKSGNIPGFSCTALISVKEGDQTQLPAGYLIGPVRELKAMAGDRQIALSWLAPNVGVAVEYYSIYRSATPSGSKERIATNLKATSYTDVNLNNGQTYYYQVWATGVRVGAAYPSSPASVEVSAMPKATSTTTCASNTWTRKADFPGGLRWGAVGFVIANKAYIGLGHRAGHGYQNDLWEYDSLTDRWTKKANFPGGPRAHAVAFSAGNKGYVGTGGTAGYGSSDFYEYNPLANTWTKKADVPAFIPTKPVAGVLNSGTRHKAFAFSITDKGYVGGGLVHFNVATGGFSHYDDFRFYEYNPSTNVWTQKADVPGGGRANAAVAFSAGNKGYVGGGGSWDYDSEWKRYHYLGPSDFQEYNPITNTWAQKTVTLRSAGATGFVLGDRVFIGTGEVSGSLSDNLTEYNFSTNTTTVKALVPSAGIKPSEDLGILPGRKEAIGFSIGNKGYIGLGNNSWTFVDGNVSSGMANDLWEYCL